MSGVRCHESLFFYKVVELVGGASVINGPTPSSLNVYANMLDKTKVISADLLDFVCD